MSDHIPDVTKMIGETPRPSSAYFKPHATMYDLAGEMKLMERELNAANERIKRLEEELERTKQDRNAIAKNTREPLLLKLDHAAERIKRLEDSVSYWNECYNDLNHKVQNRDNY